MTSGSTLGAIRTALTMLGKNTPENSDNWGGGGGGGRGEGGGGGGGSVMAVDGIWRRVERVSVAVRTLARTTMLLLQ